MDKVRSLGQCWTPSWVAELMVKQFADGPIFDPAFGAGAFYDAAIKLNGSVVFNATEIDHELVANATGDPSLTVEECDFLGYDLNRRFANIVANPPYVRHHRMSQSQKLQAKEICRKVMGFTIDARAGLHVYFLIKCLHHLHDNGKLVCILPADVCEGIFAEDLWYWIIDNFCVEKTVTFTSEASPFPNLDINTVILVITRKPQTSDFEWVRIYAPNSSSNAEVVVRSIQEAIKTGLSRPPATHSFADWPILSDFATVSRGIATGANEFFFLTSQEVEHLKLPMSCFRRAVGRTRDLLCSALTSDILDNLDHSGRPTYLLYLGSQSKNELPPEVVRYIEHGESLNLHQRALIKTRSPWYKMEQRNPPDILFAYLGRRNVRFIRNRTDTLPLTAFLCVYANPEIDPEKLFAVLNHERVIANLGVVGKSYGSGAIKVEPGSLKKLPIPPDLAETLKG